LRPCGLGGVRDRHFGVTADHDLPGSAVIVRDCPKPVTPEVGYELKRVRNASHASPRSYALNPGYFAIKELEAFLSRIAQADTDLRQRTAD